MCPFFKITQFHEISSSLKRSCTDKNATGQTGLSVVLATSIVGTNHQRKQLLLIFTLVTT